MAALEEPKDAQLLQQPSAGVRPIVQGSWLWAQGELSVAARRLAPTLLGQDLPQTWTA